MFAEERHNLILQSLNDSGKVLVRELAERFAVTEDSIRKDLSTLEQAGLLKRTYGGAVSLNKHVRLTEANRRRITALEAKRHIANIAVRLIKPSQLVFLDISTISIAIAQLLARSTTHLHILTNMLDVAALLAPNPAIELICAPGYLNRSRDGFSDSLALDFLDHFNPDIAFLAASALDLDNNFATANDTDAATLKAHILHNSNAAFLLADDSKFNRHAAFRFADILTFNAIISNSAPPSSNLNFITR